VQQLLLLRRDCSRRWRAQLAYHRCKQNDLPKIGFAPLKNNPVPDQVSHFLSMHKVHKDSETRGPATSGRSGERNPSAAHNKALARNWVRSVKKATRCQTRSPIFFDAQSAQNFRNPGPATPGPLWRAQPHRLLTTKHLRGIGFVPSKKQRSARPGLLCFFRCTKCTKIPKPGAQPPRAALASAAPSAAHNKALARNWVRSVKKATRCQTRSPIFFSMHKVHKNCGTRGQPHRAALASAAPSAAHNKALARNWVRSAKKHHGMESCRRRSVRHWRQFRGRSSRPGTTHPLYHRGRPARRPARFSFHQELALLRQQRLCFQQQLALLRQKNIPASHPTPPALKSAPAHNPSTGGHATNQPAPKIGFVPPQTPPPSTRLHTPVDFYDNKVL